MKSCRRRVPCRVILASLGLSALVLTAAPLAADISGSVLVAGSGDPGTPIAGARVHLQADLSTVVISAADGSFTLPVSGPGPFVVTAGVEYDRDAAVNYNTSGTSVPADPASGVEIRLAILPIADNPDYDQQIPLAVECGTCHFDQYQDWMTSNHSFAGEDAWVLDLFSGTGTPGGGAGYVFRDLHDPDDTGFCATCHTPLADVFDPGGVFLDEVTVPGALQGVTCVSCHQIDSVTEAIDSLHHLGGATYRFPQNGFPTSLFVWGPLDDVSFGGMRASYAPHFLDPLLCATCHQYTNPATGAPGQNTYREWLDSPWAIPGPAFRTCQDCHMPAASEPGPICVVGDAPVRPPERRRSHQVIGATPETLAGAISLATTAVVVGGELEVVAEVSNHGAGHAFPTGVSVRNALLVISAAVDGQPLEQTAGPQVPSWVDDEVPGQQPGDYAGEPGKGFAKVLEGRINGEGPVVRPVLFIDAEGVYADTLIPSGESDPTTVRFALPGAAGGVAEVTARLLYRRAYRAIAVTKGWTETPQGGPIEIEVARRDLAVDLAGNVIDIPTLSPWALALLAALTALTALAVLRRRGLAR